MGQIFWDSLLEQRKDIANRQTAFFGRKGGRDILYNYVNRWIWQSILPPTYRTYASWTGLHSYALYPFIFYISEN